MKINISIEATPEEVREVLGMAATAKTFSPCLEKISKSMEDEGQINPEDLVQAFAPSFQMGKEFLEALMKNMEAPKESSSNKPL